MRGASIVAGLVLGLVGACGGQESASGVIVRQVLRGNAAQEPQADQPNQAARAPEPIVPSTGTTLVFDQPQAIYRSAQEQARRTFDADHLRRNLASLAETID